MTFVSRNHGIFTTFAKFYVRCRKWRRREHIRRKRSCPSGLFSPFLFGISLIFWNIFGVATSGVTTMNINFSSSTTKDTNSNTGQLTTTLGTDITSTCGDKETCTNTDDVSQQSPNDLNCGVDFSVCNDNNRTRNACENYTCVFERGEENCHAQRCLDLPSYDDCTQCLCYALGNDTLVYNSLTKFKTILSRVDCKPQYSMWNCTHCLAVYRDWLCATHGLYNNPDDVNETKPCLDMCTSVMSHCPYLVPYKLYGGSPSFQCPKFSDLESNHTYANEGECFVCDGPSSHDYNDSMPCVLHTKTASSGSKGMAMKFVLPVWLVFLMRISVYFNTASYS